jgi:Protein of unknown function C-terminus (DUF2399)
MAVRFDADAYREAAASLSPPRAVLNDPRHRPAPDDPLVAELDRQRIAVPEEAVLDQLVTDLRRDQAGVRAVSGA